MNARHAVSAISQAAGTYVGARLVRARAPLVPKPGAVEPCPYTGKA